jgi:hypothetical protein
MTNTDRDSGDELSLGAYAEVLAHIAHFKTDDPADVLARLGIGAETWKHGDGLWLGRMQNELQNGETSASEEFARFFATAKRRLETERPTLAEIGALPTALASTDAGGASDVDRGQLAPSATRPFEGSADETAFMPALTPTNPLPFAKARQAAPPMTAVESDTRTAGSTQEVPAILADRDATLPFVNSASATLWEALRNQLTLEQYASLRAELENGASPRAATLQRYGLDERGYELLVDAWRAHFDAHPAADARWRQLVAEFRVWLERHRG